MEIRFHVTGAARKAFVTAVGNLVGWEPIYTKAPTFAYVVNNLTIDKVGTLVCPEGMDITEAEQLLAAQGYVSEDVLPTAVSLGEDATEESTPTEGPVLDSPTEAAADVDVQEDTPIRAFPEQAADAPDHLSIELPLAGLTDVALRNLENPALSTMPQISPTAPRLSRAMTAR